MAHEFLGNFGKHFPSSVGLGRDDEDRAGSNRAGNLLGRCAGSEFQHRRTGNRQLHGHAFSPTLVGRGIRVRHNLYAPDSRADCRPSARGRCSRFRRFRGVQNHEARWRHVHKEDYNQLGWSGFLDIPRKSKGSERNIPGDRNCCIRLADCNRHTSAQFHGAIEIWNGPPKVNGKGQGLTGLKAGQALERSSRTLMRLVVA